MLDCIRRLKPPFSNEANEMTHTHALHIIPRTGTRSLGDLDCRHTSNAATGAALRARKLIQGKVISMVAKPINGCSAAPSKRGKGNDPNRPIHL